MKSQEAGAKNSQIAKAGPFHKGQPQSLELPILTAPLRESAQIWSLQAAPLLPLGAQGLPIRLILQETPAARGEGRGARPETGAVKDGNSMSKTRKGSQVSGPTQA